MGEAHVASTNGAESLYWNPAGLIVGPTRSLAAGFQPMAEDISSNQLAASAKFNRFAVGIGYGSVSANDLDALDTFGNQTGSFEAKDQTVTASIAYGIPTFSIGASAKLWSSEIDGVSADATMADVGLAFQNPLFARVRHGVAVRNIGSDVSYLVQKDPLPLTTVFGTSIRFGERFMLSGDYGHERESGGYGAAGLEWIAIKGEKLGIALRGGYNTRRSDTGDLAGLAAGAGLSWKIFSFDYAWIPFGDIGDSHAVTLRMEFGSESARTFVSPSAHLEKPTVAAEKPAKRPDPTASDQPAPVKSKIVEPEKKTRVRTPTRRRISTLETPRR